MAGDDLLTDGEVCGSGEEEPPGKTAGVSDCRCERRLQTESSAQCPLCAA